MPADPTRANPDDRSKLSLTLTSSAQTDGECGRAVHTSRLSSTSLPPTRAIRNRINGRPKQRTRNTAPSIYLLRVISEGAGC
jgi:hypothetical protein